MLVVLVIVSLSLAMGLAGVLLHSRSRARVRNDLAEISVLRERLTVRSRELADARRAARAQGDALSRAAAARATLLRDIAEVMRGPLNAVVGFSDVMSAAGSAGCAQDQALVRIRAGAQALKDLAARIGDLAEADRPDATLAFDPIDPGLIARRVCARLMAAAATAGVSLQAPKPEAGVTVLADPDRVAIILTELVRNAVRHTPSGGAVLLDISPRRDGVAISVHDTGEGIAPERLADIFQAFGRADGRRGGLGLAIASRTALAMGGDLTATSLSGEGSTFTLTLPSARPDPDFASPPRTLSAPTTVLYIDSDPASALLMRQVARIVGPVQLHVASTAAEGLELARSLRPDVVIVEMDLPDGSGAALKRRLGLEPLTRDIPVIALSVSAQASALRLAVQEGFIEHLTKPLNLDDLTAAIEQASVRRTPIRTALAA